MLNDFFFSFENHAVYEIMWKTRTGQATDDNMEHAQCTLDTYSYKHTLQQWLHDSRLNITLYSKLPVLSYL